MSYVLLFIIKKYLNTFLLQARFIYSSPENVYSFNTFFFGNKNVGLKGLRALQEEALINTRETVFTLSHELLAS